MQNLIVGSVFATCERNPFWSKIQMDFLKKTTSNFHRVIFLNGQVDEQLFNDSYIIGRNESDSTKSINGIKQSHNHLLGIKRIIDYFRSNKARYYLLLDSDCFPICNQWIDILVDKMNHYKKTIANIVRVENLDIFPHPSAMFIKGDYINSNLLNFSMQKTRNLLGHQMQDVGCHIPHNKAFPLIRTNRYNYHPVFGGIYYDMFYHHGCGSRVHKDDMRSKKYYLYNSKKDVNVFLFNKLKEDPIKYINKICRSDKELL